tara:strand:- start:404 stop:1384 length:981 start_codon:yes stop_codon:yes gene_type:complete
MIKINQLNKSYGSVNVLYNFDLNIKSGSITSIVGASGSGKTTLLRLISGLEIPNDGEIILNGDVVNSKKKFIPPEKRDCSLVFQDYALFPNISMIENIYFGKNSFQNKEKIEELIQLTDIEGILEKFPHECSGGEQQRVALVRSLAINPSLIMMDEPLSNLDSNLKVNLNLMIRKLLKKYKTTAIVVTHDIADALEISDEIAVISDGKIIQKGSPDDVYNNPVSKKVATHFGETNFIPLKMFPDSKKFLFDEETQDYFVSLRPNQFIICDGVEISGKKIFTGKIDSIRRIGSKYKIELECEDYKLKISLNTSNKLSKGETLNVISL